MPAHHPSAGVVLELPVDRLDRRRVCRPQRKQNVHVGDHRVLPLQLELHVDIDGAAALVLRPAVYGEGSGILPGVIPTQYAHGTVDRVGLPALEGEDALFFVGLFVYLRMGGEGPSRATLRRVDGLVDNDIGHSPCVGVGGVGDGSLDLGRFHLPLARHLDKHLLLHHDGRGGGGRGWYGCSSGRANTQTEGIGSVPGHAAEVVLGEHTGHEGVFLPHAADATEFHSLRHYLGRFDFRLIRFAQVGVGIVGLSAKAARSAASLLISHATGLSEHVESAAGGGRSSPTESYHTGLGPVARTGPTTHQIVPQCRHLTILDRLGLLLHLLLRGGLLGLLEHERHLLLMTVHFEIGSDGGGGDVLLVPTGGENLVEGEDYFKGVFVNGMFGYAPGHVGDDLRKET
mmetsp:Transcript_20087/g.36097  ORF Transcript_20087/g.36097 Transcript_20087/m.36097 type:complete len:401 (+) Transcript_20087:1064-2266(+)